LHSDGSCKNIDAKCNSATYAVAAHDNVAATGCVCVANCPSNQCASKTTCTTCTQTAWNAAADFTWRKDSTCADTLIYCASGAKVVCGGACVVPAANNCGKLIFHAKCKKYELINPGSEYAKYKL
jgi:hypothetical protein